MAKFDYGKTLQTSQRLLEKFGNPVSMIREADMSVWERKYDPVTETFTWTNTDTNQEQDTEPDDQLILANGVFTSINIENLDNSLIKSSDKQLLIVDIPAPKVGDKFIGQDGITFNYVTHEKVDPAGVNVLYKIVVRV